MLLYTNLKNALKKPDKVKKLRLQYNAKVDYSTLAELSELEDLTLISFFSSRLPISIQKLPKLKVLNISSVGRHIPDWIFDLIELEVFALYNSQFRSFPVGVRNFAKLRELSLSGNQITSIPNIIEQLPKNLERLYLHNNLIKKLPKKLDKLTNLTHLDLSHNRLTNLLDDLAQMPKLQEVNLDGNPFYEKLGQHQRNFNEFFKQLNQTTLDSEQRLLWWALFTQNRTLLTRIATPYKLAEICGAKFSTLRRLALTNLQEYTPSPFLEKQLQNLSISSTGRPKDTTLKKVQELLKADNIQFRSKLGVNTTHLLVGEFPQSSKLAFAKEHNIPLITTGHLMSYLNQHKGYLNAKDDDTQTMVANIQNLIESKEEANQELALQILQGGGVPAQIFYDILALFVLSKNQSRQKRIIEDIFQNYLDPILCEHILLQGVFNVNKIDFNEYMNFLCQKGIDPNKLGIKVYQISSQGASFCLQHPESFMEIAKEYTKRSVMNLEHADISFLPPTIQAFPQLKVLYLQHNKLSKLPLEMKALQKLYTLNLAQNQFNEFPEVVCQLPALQQLSLEHNQLTSVPELIGEMPRLKLLRLDNNRIKTLSDTIYQLQHLEVLNLKYNPICRENHLIKALKEGLPNCQIMH